MTPAAAAPGPRMLAAVDVQYTHDRGLAACVVFPAWDADWPAAEYLHRIDHVAPYEPGRFSDRELPGLLAVLGTVVEPLELVIVDGYVFLDADGRPGLGAHLHDALGVPVIGVAKTSFHGSPHAIRLTRSESVRPLFVTAVGVDAEHAAGWIRDMHGPHRMPTLLTWVDQLAKRVRG